MKKIYIADITLKELAQSREVSLLFREKTAIASAANALGADAVELAPVKNLREDTIIYKTIASTLKGCTVAIPAGFSEDEVASAWECVKDAEKARLQVVVPTSTVSMEYTYHIKAEKMLPKISSLINEALKFCEDVEFVALDATRADYNFLENCVVEAANAGAKIITLCDTAGIALPEEMAELVSKIKNKISASVFVQVSDNLSMAVATAISSVRAGAEGVKCALAGDKVLATGALSDAVSRRGETFGAYTDLKSMKVHTSTRELLEKISHDVPKNDNSDNSQSSILLSAESTLSEVSDAAKILGYDLSDEDCGTVCAELKKVCEKKNSVAARELEALIASFAMQAPSKYHLESYTTNCGNLTSSMSQVTLRCGNELLCGVSTGDGPIDSVFRAIENSIGYHYELDDFQIQAVTEGKEALGSALVRLRSQGKLYSGNGISTDIVAASISAYINALNKIVFEEN